jgi:DNA-binding response OmpR family regulator
MLVNKGKPLVLIVDDNPKNLTLMGKLLSDNHYEVGMAQSGEQALNFVRKNQPDLILLDVMMPEMDGFEVCRKLKSQLVTQHIPVIFLTAKTETDDIVKGFEAGGVDYVTKPSISEELLARIKTHIEVKILRGLLPICSRCKKVRDDEGFWKQIDEYVEKHSQAVFSHGICPECLQKLYGEKDWFKKKFPEE